MLRLNLAIRAPLRRRRRSIALLVPSGLQAPGDVMVAIDDVALWAGRRGTIDVWISSSDVDNLFLFNYEFEITGDDFNVGLLRFVNPQSNLEVNHINYVFDATLGGSGGFSSIVQNAPLFDSIQGGDFLASGQDIMIDNTRRLLVQLDVEHVLPIGIESASAMADRFFISLIDSENTFFIDSNDTTSSIAATSFTHSGVVTISVIPEPLAAIAIISWTLPIMHLRRVRLPFLF